MAIYTVHVPPGDGVTAARAERVRFVKDGFSFAALIFGPFWLLWQRMWLALVLYIAVTIGIEVLARTVDSMAATVIGIAFSLWFALEARDILRWTLARRGLHTAAVVEGSDRDAAERRFFETWIAGATQRPGADAAPAMRPPRTMTSTGPAIGMFPAPGGR